MTNLNIPKELLKTEGIDYDSLPTLPPIASPAKKYLGHVVLTIVKMTVIGAVAIYLLKLSAGKIVEFYLYSNSRKFSPITQQRLREAEEKIHAIAKKTGIINPKKIKLGIENCVSQAAAVGKSQIILSPAVLIRPEDLPQELKLTRLDNKELTEEEWMVKFEKWGRQTFQIITKKPTSQFEVDETLVTGKILLKILKNQKAFEKMFEAIVAHELGHCVNNHSSKALLKEFGWNLLALPTLGISTLFHDKVSHSSSKKHEIEADLFSYSTFGSEGLIKVFKEALEIGKILHVKYPQCYDENGNNKNDHKHPPLSERIRCLELIDRIF